MFFSIEGGILLSHLPVKNIAFTTQFFLNIRVFKTVQLCSILKNIKINQTYGRPVTKCQLLMLVADADADC